VKDPRVRVCVCVREPVLRGRGREGGRKEGRKEARKGGREGRGKRAMKHTHDKEVTTRQANVTGGGGEGGGGGGGGGSGEGGT